MAGSLCPLIRQSAQQVQVLAKCTARAIKVCRQRSPISQINSLSRAQSSSFHYAPLANELHQRQKRAQIFPLIIFNFT
jgi:hypothetical protein